MRWTLGLIDGAILVYWGVVALAAAGIVALPRLLTP